MQIILDYQQQVNEYGVKGKWVTPGIQFSGGPILIPDCCLNCHHLDYGDFGEFNERLGPPYCKVNLRFPTKKGSCKRQKRR